MMHFPIKKDDQAQWLSELSVIERQYPYFILPKIIKELDSSASVSPKTIFQFGLNPTLIHYLTNQIQEGLYYGISKVSEKKGIQDELTIVEVLEVQNVEEDFEISSEKDLANIEQHKNTGESDHSSETEEIVIESLSSKDFLQSQGIAIDGNMPNREELENLKSANKNTITHTENDITDRSLLVQMSFGDWLKMITEKKRLEKEDKLEQDLLKNKWKQQKLAEAIQEENDEIPEQVFQMAVESIEKEDSLVSESLAEVYRIQGKVEQAINMYRKLILLNPEKKVYFADKIEQLQKDSI